MSRKAVIFDFNGTMFQDTWIQEQAWLIFFERYYQISLTAKDFSEHIHGRPNRYILNRYCKEKICEEQYICGLLGVEM